MTEKIDEPKTAEKAPVAAPAKKAPAKKLKAKKRSKAKGPGRGRPTWQPSIEERIAVERMKFCGESEATIARSMKVDVATLRKHCEVELRDGYANCRRQVTKMLFEAAGEGNVTAIKQLNELGKISGSMDMIASRAEAAGAKAEPKPPKLGKKEQRQAMADAVVGKFAPPPPPKLVVNNGRKA